MKELVKTWKAPKLEYSLPDKDWWDMKPTIQTSSDVLQHIPDKGEFCSAQKWLL